MAPDEPTANDQLSPLLDELSRGTAPTRNVDDAWNETWPVLARARRRHAQLRVASVVAVLIVFAVFSAAIASVRHADQDLAITDLDVAGSSTVVAPTSSANVHNPALPDQLEVSCDATTASISSPRVRPRRDGVHIRVAGDPGWIVAFEPPASAQVRQSYGTGPNGDAAGTVLELPPDSYTLRCRRISSLSPPQPGTGATPDDDARVIGTVEVVDQDGLFQEPEGDAEHCPAPGRQHENFGFDGARVDEGLRARFGDGIEIARYHYPDGLTRPIRVRRGATVLAVGTERRRAKPGGNATVVETGPQSPAVLVGLEVCEDVAFASPVPPPANFKIATHEDAIREATAFLVQRGWTTGPTTPDPASRQRVGLNRLEAKFVRVDELAKIPGAGWDFGPPTYSLWVVAFASHTLDNEPVYGVVVVPVDGEPIGSQTQGREQTWNPLFDDLPDHGG